MKITSQIASQYVALTRGCGVADVSDRTWIAVMGGDRVRFLHAFCTNDVKALSPGAGCEAFVTNHQGKTIGHVNLLCQPDRILVDGSPGQAAALIAHWDRFVISEDVQFQDCAAVSAALLLSGPETTNIWRQISAGESLPLGLLEHRTVPLAGKPTLVCRLGWTGPDSYLLRVDRQDLGAVKNAIFTAGATACDSQAVDLARIEAGSLVFGQDVRDDYLPQEINRGAQAISFKKGCYLGQETVARIDALGHVNWQTAGVQWVDASAPVPAVGAELKVDDKVVGHVTSVAYSIRLGAPLAIARLKRLLATIGTRFSTQLGDMQVVSLPLA